MPNKCSLCSTVFPPPHVAKRDFENASVAKKPLCPACLKRNRQALDAVRLGRADACLLRLPEGCSHIGTKKKRSYHET